MCVQRLHGEGARYSQLTVAQREEVRTAANELYMATVFIAQADKRRYGKLQEELENDFTKGNDNYPTDLVKAYHMLSEYKHYVPKPTPIDTNEVAFVQTEKEKKAAKQAKEEWMKTATCHGCGKKGHIKPNCPQKDTEDDSDSETEAKEKEKKKPKGILKKKKKKKETTFANIDIDSDDDDDENFGSRQYQRSCQQYYQLPGNKLAHRLTRHGSFG